MSDDPSRQIPPTKEAQDVLDDWRTAVADQLKRVNKIPLKIVVWGPANSSTSDGLLRYRLRDELTVAGHAVQFPEETTRDDNASLWLHEFVQAREGDLVVAVASSSGSIHETGRAIPTEIAAKLVVLLDKRHADSFHAKTVHDSQPAGRYTIMGYDDLNDAEIDRVTKDVVKFAQKMRERKFFELLH